MLDRLLVVNLALLITHQIDAAFWHEWDMFGLPGGVQLFNVLNLLIFLVMLGCSLPVVRRERAGFACSLVIAGGCALVLPIHAGFALAGFTQFNMPVSMAVIVVSFPLAVLQVFVTLRQRALFHGQNSEPAAAADC